MYVTVEEVKQYTGAVIDTAAITQSQTIIEMFTNRTEGGSKGVTDRDLHWLKLATAYQAAYMDAHPELFSIMDADSVSQGDLSISFRSHADGAMIAPLAKKALRMVGWNRSRSLKVKSDFVRNVDIINQGDPPESDWTPLPQ